MNPLLVKSVGYLGLLLCIMFLLYKVTLFWNPIAIQKQTVSFLKAVQEQNYDRAAELFGWEGQKTAGSKESAWKQLAEEEGVRLLSFSNVRAEYDDGCYCTGHADLVFEVNGSPMQVRAVITFGAGARPKQICAITPSGMQGGSIAQIAAWNSLACGNGSF
ncbi:hypothetical protein [Paenibacillus sp. OAS669]|uniref:hypothetical protein n=1 Tax=Paenibacillus sp. OAS669 TaxID=2663821 RepID=UPI00178940C5|nr:hypothetical protein [Paenibacillus sp. OAS669]MBE1444840.1 hypothetical protein [Paenibacillus sp. OAS669]